MAAMLRMGALFRSLARWSCGLASQRVLSVSSPRSPGVIQVAGACAKFAGGSVGIRAGAEDRPFVRGASDLHPSALALESWSPSSSNAAVAARVLDEPCVAGRELALPQRRSRERCDGRAAPGRSISRQRRGPGSANGGGHAAEQLPCQRVALPRHAPCRRAVARACGVAQTSLAYATASVATQCWTPAGLAGALLLHRRLAHQLPHQVLCGRALVQPPRGQRRTESRDHGGPHGPSSRRGRCPSVVRCACMAARKVSRDNVGHDGNPLSLRYSAFVLVCKCQSNYGTPWKVTSHRQTGLPHDN